jgi:hypothetical protein
VGQAARHAQEMANRDDSLAGLEARFAELWKELCQGLVEASQQPISKRNAHEGGNDALGGGINREVTIS